MRSNQKQWKTLGLTTATRVWVTMDLNSGNIKNYIKPLTFNGQTVVPTQKQVKMSFWAGRSFTTFRLTVQLVSIYFMLKSLKCIFIYLYQQSMLLISMTSPQMMLLFFTIIACICAFVWYRLVTKLNSFSWVFGCLTLISFSVAVTLLKTLSTFGVKFLRKPRSEDLQSILNINSFVDINKITPDQKQFVVLAYKNLVNLIARDAYTRHIPKANLFFKPAHGFAAVPFKVKPFLTALPLRLTRPWPTISSDRVSLLAGRSLLLYHWQNLQPEIANSLYAQNLWHFHKLGVTNFSLSKINNFASTTALSKTKPTFSPNWLIDFLPSQVFTTTIINTQLYPVRFDLIQSLRTNTSSLWFFKVKKV